MRVCETVIAVFAALLLSPCGRANDTEPDTGPVARARFISFMEMKATKGITVLRQYDDSDCRTGERELARFSRSPHWYTRSHKRIGIPMDPDLSQAQKTEVRVRANQPFYGIFSASEVDQSCRVAFAFVPRDAQDYEVSFRWNYRVGTCNALLARLDRRSSPISIALPRGQCAEALHKTRLY